MYLLYFMVAVLVGYMLPMGGLVCFILGCIVVESLCSDED